MGQARNMTDAKAIKRSDCSRGVAGSSAGTVERPRWPSGCAGTINAALYRHEVHADGAGRAEAKRPRLRTDTPKKPQG